MFIFFTKFFHFLKGHWPFAFDLWPLTIDSLPIYFFELRSYHRNLTIEDIFSILLIAQLTMIYTCTCTVYLYLYRCFMNDGRSCFSICSSDVDPYQLGADPDPASASEQKKDQLRIRTIYSIKSLASNVSSSGCPAYAALHLTYLSDFLSTWFPTFNFKNSYL